MISYISVIFWNRADSMIGLSGCARLEGDVAGKQFGVVATERWIRGSARSQLLGSGTEVASLGNVLARLSNAV